MPKLTDIQLVILNAAAARGDCRALPLPASLKLAKGPAASVLAGLVKRRLLEPAPAARQDDLWREDKGKRLTLILSDAGQAALGIDTSGHKPAPKGKGSRKTRSNPPPADPGTAAQNTPRPGTKLAMLVELLRRTEGATLAEIVAAIKWQAHSVRGAISGTIKKKLGFEVASDTEEQRGRVYRIVSASPGAAQ